MRRMEVRETGMETLNHPSQEIGGDMYSRAVGGGGISEGEEGKEGDGRTD